MSHTHRQILFGASVAGWVCASVIVGVQESGRLRAAEPAAQPAASSASTSEVTPASARALLDRYCVACHNQRLKMSGLTLDQVDVAQVSAHAEVWEKVVRKLRVGLMPPVGRPRPDAATYDALASFIETAIDREAAVQPSPGRAAAFRRLTRIEYRHVIRDLLGLDVDTTTLFPAEPITFGLENIADALSLSPMLMQRYKSAAEKISRLAVGATSRASAAYNTRVSHDLPWGARGGFAVEHYFPVDGEYDIEIVLKRWDSGYDQIQGLEEPNQLDVWLDGERIQSLTVGGQGTPPPITHNVTVGGDDPFNEYVQGGVEKDLVIRVPVKAGPRRLSAFFLQKSWVPDSAERGIRVRGAIRDEADPLIVEPEVFRMVINGPYNATGPGETTSRQKVFVCRPQQASEEAACANTILTTLARRAYRRPVTDAEVATLMSLYARGRQEGSFDDGIQFALEGLLVTPSFLFRSEFDPAVARPDTPYAVSDLDLASRLSFFLWSSIPDDRLLDLAIAGRLKEPNVLAQEIQRMRADPRSAALVDNFFTQWLEVRALSAMKPDRGAFPEFDEPLRAALQRELELFLKSQLAEDRSVIDLLTANETFLNERLARHYGIPNVYGDEFRRVTLTDHARFGILGKGAVLLTTSYGNRTSPVLRGKWVLSNLLGAPPPPPPADVPDLPEVAAGEPPKSVRALLEQHRKNQVCANCHAQFDPLGLALENFDGIGRWRSEDAGAVVDASFTMPGVEPMQGVEGLQQFLLGRREVFIKAVTEKLLAYALGRVVGADDQPAIRKIVQDARSSNYRWSSILEGIVNSTAFRMRMPAAAPEPTAADTVAAHRN